MKKKIISSILIIVILLCAAPSFAKAACSHSSLGPMYSEATHPHRYYRECNLCHEIIYTGGHATKAHGTGAWGSGTCPQCGVHSFGPTYSEASHPHNYYHTCTLCNKKDYTGGHATKAHGSGAWGSGTCSQCGTHSFGPTYSEASHPHNYYHTCTLCNKKVYTGGHATKSHGTGAWGSGTCPDCGQHSYNYPTASQLEQLPHPHDFVVRCVCGDTIYKEGPLVLTCSNCLQGKKTASNSMDTTMTFYWGDVNGGLGAPALVSIFAHLDYVEYYKKSEHNSFQSFEATATCTLNNVPYEVRPNLLVFINPTVQYYNSSNSKLFESGINGTDLSKSRGVFMNTHLPSYSIITITGNIAQALTTSIKTMRVSYTF